MLELSLEWELIRRQYNTGMDYQLMYIQLQGKVINGMQYMARLFI